MLCGDCGALLSLGGTGGALLSMLGADGPLLMVPGPLLAGTLVPLSSISM
jgi:hypothetical protein